RKLRAYVDHVGKRRPIHPEYVAATVNELAAQDAVFTVDTGMCAVWGARYLEAAKNRRIIGSFNRNCLAGLFTTCTLFRTILVAEKRLVFAEVESIGPPECDSHKRNCQL